MCELNFDTSPSGKAAIRQL